MADARSLFLTDDVPAGPSPLERKLRAFWRRAGRAAQRLAGRRPIEGFVDGVLVGDVRGWAFDPNTPHLRVHVVALCEGRVVGQALADLSRRDLIQDGRGDGRHAFNLKLPAALLEGPPRRVSIEAVSRWGRARLIGGDIVIGGGPGDERPASSPASVAGGRARAMAPGDGQATLLLWGESAAAEASVQDWSEQAWPDLALGRLGAGTAEQLLTLIRTCHTVVLARAGDRIEPHLARQLVQTRPLADVITWDFASAGHRTEAHALGVLLGGGLGDAVAVRRHVFDMAPREVIESLAAGNVRSFEVWLASQPVLRWAHLPAVLSFRQTPGERLIADRVAPSQPAKRITIAVWPHGSDAAPAAIEGALAGLPDCEIEILAAPGSHAGAASGRPVPGEGPARDLVSVRPVDPPAGGGAGDWLATLGEAATGEAIVFAHADVELPGAAVLAEMAAWALAPNVGAVTLELRAPGARPLAGLALARTDTGWVLASAYDPQCAGRSRPVLAAPEALMVVSRAKLAALGGIDARRFGDSGAALDLALRLRRMGCHSVLLGETTSAARLPSATRGPGLAGFDAAELAAAANAFPDLALPEDGVDATCSRPGA